MDKLESSIHKFIDNRTKGADIYINQGSTWMILTDKKRWIFELEKNGSLWYNYHFFEPIFNFFSHDVVEKQEYITTWVEDVVKNGVNCAFSMLHNRVVRVEDVVKNGVKNTFIWGSISDSLVEDIIKNGVKKTWYEDVMDPKLVANALKNGIKIIKDTICLDSELEGKTTYIVENCKKENRQQIIVNSFED